MAILTGALKVSWLVAVFIAIIVIGVNWKLVGRVKSLPVTFWPTVKPVGIDAKVKVVVLLWTPLVVPVLLLAITWACVPS